ncbi:MAG: glycosyltransferase family 4 protein [Clostridia bacterium]|nr:glycosyltransferase family 4 protein [Clostridia bacterium]
MRILYIINAFSWGGAEKLVYDLALNIRLKVESVSVAALYLYNDDTEKEMTRVLNEKGIRTYILGKPAGAGRMKGLIDVYRIVKENRCTIIHGHCSVPMLFAKIVGKMAGIPAVCTVHNTKGYSAIKEKLTSWMCRRYISIGEAAEEYMVKALGIPAAKITRIYNAADIHAFENISRKEDFWLEYGGKSSELKCLNVARVTQQKNQMCAVRAVKDCLSRGREVHLFILGAYDEADETYQELRAYVQDNGLSEHVTFLGMHTNVWDFLANADCFIMTSRYEGLSVAFLEAVVCGTPIICTDMPFVRELMKIGACAAVIDQDDSKALSDLLIHAAWRTPAQETVEKFKKLFSMEQFTEKHLIVYQQLCGENLLHEQ